MNSRLQQSDESWSAKTRAGHTLTELMVSMSLLTLVVVAVISCHLAGLRFNWFVQPKIENSQYTRETLTRLIEEIRCATSVQVGSGSVTNFVPVGATNVQAGNALRVYPSTNTTQFIYYFHDPAAMCLNRVPLGGSQYTSIADSVTNDNVFEMEDLSGTVLTNSQNNAVLSILLQMQRALPIQGMSDNYQIISKITRRSIF